MIRVYYTALDDIDTFNWAFGWIEPVKGIGLVGYRRHE